MSRKPVEEVTPKQLEVYELILNHVREKGYQPNVVELRELLNVQSPSIRARIRRLVEKGLLQQPKRRGERCYGFNNVKFLAYVTDDEGRPAEQECRVDGMCVSFRKSPDEC